MVIPTQYPFPVSPGGMRNANFSQPLRQPGLVRPPDQGSPPKVVSIAGFGAGAGASIEGGSGQADQAHGQVAIRLGNNAATSGTVVLAFTPAPLANQYFFAAGWATLTPAIAGNNVTLSWIANSWTSNNPPPGNTKLVIAYSWSASQ